MDCNHKTYNVKVGNIMVGSDHPVVVQSMTNTDTADIDMTVIQILELVQSGSEIVRLTVNNAAAAKAVPYIKEKLLLKGCDTALVGCFHYNGHILLSQYPDMAKALAKYRINPGNVGFGRKHDHNFQIMVETAIQYNKPIRIGVNWGSLDQGLTTRLMNDNIKLAKPLNNEEIIQQALVISAIQSAKKAEQIGLSKDKIIVSAKVSNVNDLVKIYTRLAKECNYALHLGLTEAGMGNRGLVVTTAALSILLNQGIGNTIRASITPKPGQARTDEVKLCHDILQSLGLRNFSPRVTACPGCGRTTSSFFQHLAQDIESYINDNMPMWQHRYNGVENLKIAVMGCIVNGPGESKHADIGISLPGNGENSNAPVFIDGKKAMILRGDNIADDFKNILNKYIDDRFANKEISQSV